MSLDRNKSLALHQQLRSLLADQIAQNILKPGMRLPSERQICEEHGLSRTTVRQALRDLEREGLVRIVPGLGTFVAEPQALTVKVSLSGFTVDVQRAGGTLSSVLLEARLITEPGPDLVRALRLQPGDEVAVVERLRLVNNFPMALHRAYLNHHYCPQILQSGLPQVSLPTLLRERYGLKLVRAEEQVYAALADQREMQLLGLSYPAPVLRTERTTFLDTGDVIEFALTTNCGERYRLSVQLESFE